MKLGLPDQNSALRFGGSGADRLLRTCRQSFRPGGQRGHAYERLGRGRPALRHRINALPLIENVMGGFFYLEPWER